MPRQPVFHAKSLMLMLKFVDMFLPSISFLLTLRRYLYQASRKTTSIIVSPFPHEAPPSPAASVMYLANSASSALKQASILIILPCKRGTTVKPSRIEIG
jgi:hypothetical protein